MVPDDLEPDRSDVETMSKARVRVETEFKEDRLLQAKLLGAIGGTYGGLGLANESAELGKRAYDIFCGALGPEHPDTLGAMYNMACSYWRLGRIDESIPLFEATLRLCRKVWGEDDPDTLLVMANLGTNYDSAGRLDEAIALLEETLRLCREKLARSIQRPF